MVRCLERDLQECPLYGGCGWVSKAFDLRTLVLGLLLAFLLYEDGVDRASGGVFIGENSRTLPVFSGADAVVLHDGACQVIHGVGQSWMAGKASDDDAHLAGEFCNKRDAGQAALSGVIAPLEDVPGFGEQRGEDNAADTRQRCEDCCQAAL